MFHTSAVRLHFLSVVFAASLAALAPVAANAQSMALTTLRGGTPPLLALSQDQGALPDSTPANRMLLVLDRKSVV